MKSSYYIRLYYVSPRTILSPPTTPKWGLCIRFSDKNFTWNSHFLMGATRPAHFILCNLIPSHVMWCENFSECVNILLRTAFSSSVLIPLNKRQVHLCMGYFYFPVAYWGALYVDTYADVIWLEVFIFRRKKKKYNLRAYRKKRCFSKKCIWNDIFHFSMRLECNLCPSHVCTTSARCPSLDPWLLIPPPLFPLVINLMDRKEGWYCCKGPQCICHGKNVLRSGGVPFLYACCAGTSTIALNPNVYS